jgi:hypothetical protein
MRTLRSRVISLLPVGLIASTAGQASQRTSEGATRVMNVHT